MNYDFNSLFIVEFNRFFFRHIRSDVSNTLTCSHAKSLAPAQHKFHSSYNISNNYTKMANKTSPLYIIIAYRPLRGLACLVGIYY